MITSDKCKFSTESQTLMQESRSGNHGNVTVQLCFCLSPITCSSDTYVNELKHANEKQEIKAGQKNDKNSALMNYCNNMKKTSGHQNHF